MKPYTCNWPNCDYQCNANFFLENHTRTHTGDKPYKCPWPDCKFEAAQKVNIRHHLRTHTGEKPFACRWSGCAYRATQQPNVDNHYRTHTGAKPFACTWPGCFYRAAQQPNVDNHYRTHTGEKPFKCPFPECSYQSTQRGNRDWHVKRHHSVNPFKRSKRSKNDITKPCIASSAKPSNKEMTQGMTAVKRKAAVPTSGPKRANAPERIFSPYQCQLCHVFTADLDEFVAHFQNRSHQEAKWMIQCSGDGCLYRTSNVNKLLDHLHRKRFHFDSPDRPACILSECFFATLTFEDSDHLSKNSSGDANGAAKI